MLVKLPPGSRGGSPLGGPCGRSGGASAPTLKEEVGVSITPHFCAITSVPTPFPVVLSQCVRAPFKKP